VLITVLVLELRPPAIPTFRALLLLWPTWLSYAVSYLFIAIVWTNHHHLMRYATEAKPRLLWLFSGTVLRSDRATTLVEFGLSVHPSDVVRALRGRPTDVEQPASSAEGM